MRTVAAREAQARLSDLLSEVAEGASITITRDGRPIAVLAPVTGDRRPDTARVVEEMLADRDRDGPTSGGLTVRQRIEDLRDYSRERARGRGPVTIEEIKEMIEEGRR